MINGFEKIVERRIQSAENKGEFQNLSGSGKPIELTDDSFIPEDLRLAYKILKNGDFVPEEITLRKKILETKELLSGLDGTVEKYNALKKLNYMVMKLNSMRNGSILFETPQIYEENLVKRLEKGKTNHVKS